MVGGVSEAALLALLDDSQWQSQIDILTDSQVNDLLWDWRFWAREKQLAPEGSWNTWLILAGRGFGKTRCGAEWVRENVSNGIARRIAIVAPTAADARDVMVEGQSGILSVFPPHEKPKYEPSKRRVTFHTGAVAGVYSADEPERLRGPEHDLAWADELASWRYDEAFDMLQLGLRLGEHPRTCVTTTPKPKRLIKELIQDTMTFITRGSTYENSANLAPAFLRKVLMKYENTRLGRQELYAEILDDVPGALWNRALLEAHRMTEMPDLVRVVVGIDPPADSSESSAECGIVVAGVDEKGEGYVLEDASIQGTPDQWGKAAVAAYHKHRASRLVAEVNQGGAMVEHVIRTVDSKIAYKAVHATKGKYTRAEPISALYEQGKVHHLGFFGELESQMTSWVPGEKSPDRMDALVWCLTEMMLESRKPDFGIAPLSMGQESSWRM